MIEKQPNPNDKKEFHKIFPDLNKARVEQLVTNKLFLALMELQAVSALFSEESYYQLVEAARENLVRVGYTKDEISAADTLHRGLVF